MSNISRDSLTKAPVCSGEDAGDSPAPGAIILMKKDTSILNKTAAGKLAQGVDFFDWYDDPERSMGDDIHPKEVVPNHGTQDCWERPNGGRGYVK